MNNANDPGRRYRLGRRNNIAGGGRKGGREGGKEGGSSDEEIQLREEAREGM